jgi:hypothetical protein
VGNAHRVFFSLLLKKLPDSRISVRKSQHQLSTNDNFGNRVPNKLGTIKYEEGVFIMFNFNKKQEEDPQKALDNARNVVNNGLMGGITKAFMGQGFVDKMNNAMDQGQAAMDGMHQMNWVAQYGMDATAEVLSVMDTGATINMDPVVEMKMMITTPMGMTFETTARTMVSRIAVPRMGDKVKIKYNPSDPSQIAVMS